jgi:1-deoxy-D-xylulose-5-phosphate synthase
MAYNFLKNINSPTDLRQFKVEELHYIAKELREFIIENVSEYGGHLGASLGTIELTIALHYIYNTPEDLLVWDVGHQAYGHKILTGRKDNFHTNRQIGGISGFPSREESEYDTFGVGHSSTSISAALGMAIANKLKKQNKHHIAVIGDASIASGIAFEGLNHAGDTDANLLVILNDNSIGIDPSVGALKEYLSQKDLSGQKHQNTIIEALNFRHFGPIDGHDVNALVSALKHIKSIPGPKFLHVLTKKGKGLKPAEIDQVTYHAPGRFDKITGKLFEKPKANSLIKYQDVFGKTLLQLAKQDEKIIGITPAMPTGSSLKYMIEELPERAFDVGIAEQHAVTFSAGMATQGFKVFCTIYSTFLQRAYDQLIHDVALQNLPVVFCIDRAGIVGQDGATHHGVFDLAFLKCIPNLVVAAPSCAKDFQNLLYTATTYLEHPFAIRYPRGNSDVKRLDYEFESIEIGKAVCLRKGENTAILSIGKMRWNVEKAIEESDKNIGHFDMRFVKPLDTGLLDDISTTYKSIITIEDGVLSGGFGESVRNYYAEFHPQIKVKCLGIPDQFVKHGQTEKLLEQVKLSPEHIIKAINSL